MAARKEKAAVIRKGGQAHSPPATGAHLATVALLFFLGLVACSSDGSGNAAPTTTLRNQLRGTSTTATTFASVEDEIEARYRAFWEARFEAGQEPVNPDHPGLREYATGAQLENVLKETRERRERGLAFRLPENSVARSEVQVIDLAGDEATVQECAVDDTVVYRIASGEVVDDDVATYNVEGTMRRVDGEWKIAAARRVQQWEGVAGCALADE